jgi:Predicted membrane protein (DUF2306)
VSRILPPRVGPAALWLLSLGVAAYAVVVYSVFPLGALVTPAMRAAFEAHPAAISVHIFASAIALTLGPAQFSARLRQRRPALHRGIGRTYLGVGVGVGGIAGLVMATHASGGAWARLGFAALAVAWLLTGWLAYRAARRRSFVVHRRWMVRNFALTFAAVTLRLYLPSAFVAGISFETSYPVIAWLCWVPNLIVAELLFNRAARSSPTPESLGLPRGAPDVAREGPA